MGNPNVLCESPNWCAWLRFCVKHGAYRGCDFAKLKEFGGRAGEANENEDEAGGSSEDDETKLLLDQASRMHLADTHRAEQPYRRLGL